MATLNSSFVTLGDIEAAYAQIKAGGIGIASAFTWAQAAWDYSQYFDIASFSTLTNTLAAGNFLAGVSPVAQDSNQLLLYDTATGDLFYDPDGSGAAPAELIATLSGAPVLAVEDIFVS